MAIIKTIKTLLGKTLYPKTLTKAVYDEEGNRLDITLDNMKDRVVGVDIRYNSETGAPEWSERGADTFHPF